MGFQRNYHLNEPGKKVAGTAKAGRASGTKEDAKSLNMYLDLILAKAHEARKKLIEKDQPITSVAIKETLSGAAERKRMFIKIFEDHNNEMQALMEKNEYSPGNSGKIYDSKKFCC
jgi:hypothetical protein